MTILTLCIASILSAPAAQAARGPEYGVWNDYVWLPGLWRAIGECETGLDWKHSTRDYVGAFGFYRGTWSAYRGSFPADATRATPWQQYQVALRVARSVGLRAWGCFTHGGYRAHL